MKKSHQFGAVRCCMAVLLVLVYTQGHASLVGATIRGTLDFNDFNLGNCFDPSVVASGSGCRALSATAPFAEDRQTDDSPSDPYSVVMDPDPSAQDQDPLINPLGVVPEFVYDDKGFLNVSVDVDASYLEVIVTNTSGSAPSLAPYGWTVVISDFLNANSIQIFGLTPDTDNGLLFPGMTGFVINGGDAIQLFFEGRNGAFDAAILTAYTDNGELRAGFGITTVPIPAAVWLFGSGLLGLVGMARRKKAS